MLVFWQWQRGLPTDLAGGATLTASVVMMAVIGFLLKPKEESQGSVADLVKRGQLRADRGVEYVPPGSTLCVSCLIDLVGHFCCLFMLFSSDD